MNPYENACIGNYEIIKHIAPAPSIHGHVLLGRDAHGAERAIKIGTPGTEEKIFAEARTLAQLSHQNIVTICDVGDHFDNPYLVLAPACPNTLERLIRKGTLHAQGTRAFAHVILSALEYAHKKGIYHCDLAPRHVLLTQESKLVLCDFGSTNAASIESSLESTHQLGSMPYMSADQLMGKSPTPKTDLYATGTLLAHAHNGSYWDLFSPPSKDPFLAQFITNLASPNGYQTAREALDALREDPERDALAQENKYLRETALDLQGRLARNYGWSKTAIALSGTAGFLLGTAAAEQLFTWLSH